MGFIKNFDKLATTPQRKIVLELIEAALESIQPDTILNSEFRIQNDELKIQNQILNLRSFERVFLIGFGKGSALISKIIEKKLGADERSAGARLPDRRGLTEGYVIDVDLDDVKSDKILFVKGTHPLPSQTNLDFTKKVIDRFKNKLTQKDLVIVVVTGGGSALFELPHSLSLSELDKLDKALLQAGDNINEMNIVRKHLSKVKGGDLAKILYPAKVLGLIFSDVPGNDLTTIASGPTVKDETTMSEVNNILEKYGIKDLPASALAETPKEDKYFEKVENILMLSNKTALSAMKKKADELGIEAQIYFDAVQGVAKIVGGELIKAANPNSVLLAGGETTVKVKNKQRKGGRNQELVLGALSNATIEQLNNFVIASFASDGWDNTEFAGAIGDLETLKKSKELNLNAQKFLEDNNTFEFFEKVGDGITTDRLPSNVSDLMIVLKTPQR